MAEKQAVFAQANLEKLTQASHEHHFLNWAAFCAVLEFEPATSTDGDYFKFLLLLTRELGQDVPVWTTPGKSKRAGQRQEQAWMIAGFGFAYIVHLFWYNSGPGVSGFLEVHDIAANTDVGKIWRKRFASALRKKEAASKRSKKSTPDHTQLSLF